MAKYKLIYFNARGRAELARLIFAYAGQEYEDFRFEREDWPKYKDSTPFGLAPVLEVDGVPISQSKTIARFLAGRFGIAGETDIEQAQANAIVELLHDDLLGKLISIHRAPEDKKEEVRKDIVENYIPGFLANLTKQLKGDYFVGDKLTWADIAVADFVAGWFKVMQIDIELEKYPKLKEHSDRILSIPKIAEWIKNRPDTPR